MGHKANLLVFAALFTSADPASALCSYKGQLNAKTTLEQEYADSPWVVRARVLSASDWQGTEDAGTVYRLEVVQSFKGSLPRTFSYSTERNSGGFYLDRGSQPDIGGEYLLFLTAQPPTSFVPAPVRSALVINYNCGQSRRWDELSQQEMLRLAEFSRGS